MNRLASGSVGDCYEAVTPVSGFSSSDRLLGGGHDSAMRIRTARRAAELEPVEEIRLQIAALTDASIQRHRLERGTAEYAAALETEERLADRVWRLGESLGPIQRRPAEREESNTPRA